MYLLALLLALWCTPTAASAQAGANANVEIGLTQLSPSCGLQAGQRVEFLIQAQKMEGVRQIKFDFDWQPEGAIVSAVGGTGTETESNGFIVPGPPQIYDEVASFGMAVFGGAGLSGAGELALVGFELSPEITPTTPLAVYLRSVSLGPSSTERDSVYPSEAMVLANYCDDSGQSIPRALLLQIPDRDRVYSTAGRAGQDDASQGEADVVALPLSTGAFRSTIEVRWQIENPGPGTLYLFAQRQTYSVSPGETISIQTESDLRGNAPLRLDASGSEGDTTARLSACAEIDGQTLCAEGELVWHSPITAVLGEEGAALPEASRLAQNYPNPFNAGTQFTFEIAAQDGGQQTHLTIYNMLGQPVATPFAGLPTAGLHRAHWDGYYADGKEAATGMYLGRLLTANGTHIRRMMLLR